MEKNIDAELIIMGDMAAMVGSCCSAPPPSESPTGRSADRAYRRLTPAFAIHAKNLQSCCRFYLSFPCWYFYTEFVLRLGWCRPVAAVLIAAGLAGIVVSLFAGSGLYGHLLEPHWC